jgi:hypothetical protein
MDTYPDVIHWVDLRVPLKRWGEPSKNYKPRDLSHLAGRIKCQRHILTIDSRVSTSF